MTDVTRRQVWMLLHEVIRLSHYYQYVIGRLRFWNRTAVMSQVGIATGGGVLFFVQSVDSVVSVVAMFVVAFVSIMFLVLRYPERLSTAAQISARCSEIEVETRALWSDIESGLLSQDQASSRWHDIEIALDEATVLETHIGTHKGINRKAEADAARLVKEEYAQ